MSLCGLGLSCEPLPCEHGKEVRKEQCHLCDIKRQITALTDMYKSLSVRVVAQHEFKLNQVDANKIMDKKVDDIISKLEAWNDDLEYLDSLSLPKRINKLEEIIKDNPGLISRIGILGQALHELSEENHKLRKIPHKCPLCEECGVAGELVLTHCQACEGKGIVWG
jgi:hypothetical protein